MRVGECCNRLVVVCNRDASVNEAARLMKKHNIGTVVVVETAKGVNRPVGVVTDRDLVFKVLARPAGSDALMMADLVDRELATAHADDGLWETFERMRVRGIRRLAVTNSAGALLGMLAIDDVVELLAEAQRGAAKLARTDGESDRGYVSGTALPTIMAAGNPGVAEWARAA